MRVLLWACGSRGDVQPLVALAVRLRALGARVRMCAPSDSAERLAEIDVPLVTVDRPPRPGAGRAGRRPAPERVAAGVAARFDQIPAAAEGCDVVLASGLLSGVASARSVAEKRGIPYFYVVFCPINLPSVLDRAQREQYNRSADALFGDALNDRRASIGLPSVANLFDYASTDKPWLAADPVLAPVPPGLAVEQTSAWILPDERPLPAELEAFLRAGPPPVYVGFGSSSGTADAARVTVEAARAQGHRVVLSRGWDGLALPDDREDCIAVGEVNFQALFGRVAVAVHHDGAGTTDVATRAGVPQIVVRKIVDQFYYGDRLAELGVGVAVDGPVPAFDSMSAALTTALAPGTRARAAAVAPTVRSDGTTAAAELLFDAVRRNKPSAHAGTGNA